MLIRLRDVLFRIRLFVLLLGFLNNVQLKYYNPLVAPSKHCTKIKDSFLLQRAALAQMVAQLPLVQRVGGSIPGEVLNFHLKIFQPWGMVEMYTF